MKKSLSAILLLAASAEVLGCSATRANLSAYGQDNIIKQYSHGRVIGTWTSNGKLFNETNSDGFYFEDKQTGKIGELTGTLQITIAN